MAEDDRIIRLLCSRQWQTQELKRKAMIVKDGDAQLRTRLIRKCEFANAEEAYAMVKYLSTADCLTYLRMCREELNALAGSDGEWEPVQAWYTEEDATQGHARRGMLYHVIKLAGDDEAEDGPYVVQDGCKYLEEYTFYWDVDEPPELPESSSGIQYTLDIKRRDDTEGFGGLYDCILIKRETLEQDVPKYDTHQELGETRDLIQLLGIKDNAEMNGAGVDARVVEYATEQGMALTDGGGIVVDISKEKNADCTTSVSVQNTHEEEVPYSSVSTTSGQVKFSVDVTDLHTDTSAPTATPTPPSEFIEDYTTGGTYTDYSITTEQLSQTKGGKVDVRKVRHYPKKTSMTVSYQVLSRRRSSSQTTTTYFENWPTELAMEKMKTGHAGTARLNEYGLWDGQYSYEIVSDKNSSSSGDDDGEEGWENIPMTSTSAHSQSGDIYEVTQEWYSLIGYYETTLKKLSAALEGAASVSVQPANRDRTVWSVRAETPRFYIFKSLLTGNTYTAGTRPTAFPEPSKISTSE